ncbi:MAG: isoprenylcysteine carboxylmethyltransferase family protein [Paraburkholderia sp.]
MDTALAPSAVTPRVGDLALEILGRLGIAALFGVFAYLAIKHWRADPTRITLLLLVVAECFTLGLSLVVRVPMRRDWNPVAFLCALGASYYFLAVHLGPGVRLVPETVGAALQVAGICWQLFAKVSLRRSFGILPANRGVVSHGAYRFVRHPMYLGYFVMDMGFLLTNFGLQNVLVYGGQFALQAVRISREERLLSADERYRTYKGKVRYRVIPGLF